jgi:hypothetical protein
MTMAGFVGADVDQLVALAGTFERRSDAFNRIAGAASSALMVAEWTGADVDRVRSEWNSQARPAIQRVASELSALAVELRRQAEQQREASGGAGASRFVGGMPTPPAGIDPEFWATLVERIRSVAGNTLTLVEAGSIAAELLGEIKLPVLGAITGPLGIAGQGMDAVDDFLDGDWLLGLVKTGSASLSTVSLLGDLGVLTGVASRLNPLGFAISTGITFVEWTLPVTPEQVDSTYAKGVEHMFGPTVDPNNLTVEQANQMGERYAGPLGVMSMISDTMDATADRIFPWNWGKK